MERTQMDPSVTIASVNLPTPKMKILVTSPVAPIHRKAKLLTRCLLKGAVAAANPLALLLMVEDEMRYGARMALVALSLRKCECEQGRQPGWLCSWG